MLDSSRHDLCNRNTLSSNCVQTRAHVTQRVNLNQKEESMEPQDLAKTEQRPSETSRRDFLKSAGKIAIYSPPAIMLLMKSGRQALACNGSLRVKRPPRGQNPPKYDLGPRGQNPPKFGIGPRGKNPPRRHRG